MRSGSPTDTSAARAARRARIDRLAYDYPAQPKRPIRCCNLCGGADFTVVANRDRYGYPARAVACAACGLAFLSPVMTPEAYARFYAGVYRPLVTAFHGRLIDPATIQAEQREYAEERGALVEPFVRGRGFTSLLDVGGSTGIVAQVFARRFQLSATVLDPSPLEIEQARRLGLETIACMAEAYDPAGRTFDVVIMCQTVDHLLDVAGTVGAIRDLLRPDGVFFVDIVDFRAACRRAGSLEGAIKIDHPYYLTESTMEAYLARSGFDVARRDVAADRLHVSYVCRPGARRSDALPSAAAVRAALDEMASLRGIGAT